MESARATPPHNPTIIPIPNPTTPTTRSDSADKLDIVNSLLSGTLASGNADYLGATSTAELPPSSEEPSEVPSSLSSLSSSVENQSNVPSAPPVLERLIRDPPPHLQANNPVPVVPRHPSVPPSLQIPSLDPSTPVRTHRRDATATSQNLRLALNSIYRPLMATQLPRRGQRGAPSFDGSNPRDLPRYFEDVELIADECSLSATDQVKYLKYYATTEVVELWDTLPSVVAAVPVWNDVVKEIKDLYPSLADGRRYSRAEFEQLVVNWAKRGIRSRESLGQYKREFMVMDRYLISKNKLMSSEARHAFLRGITGDLRAALLRQLEIKESDHEEGNPYKTETIVTHADFILGGASYSTNTQVNRYSGTSRVPASTVKREDVSLGTVMETLRSFQIQLDALGRGLTSRGNSSGNPASSAQSGQSTNITRPQGCSFCGDLTHYIKYCPRVTEYMQAGKCIRNAENRVTLPNGNYVLSGVPGKMLMERIDYFRAQEQTPQSVNLVEYYELDDHLGNAPDNLPSNEMSVNFLGYSSGPAKNDQSVGMVAVLDEGHDDNRDDMETARLEVLLGEAKKKASAARKAKFDPSQISKPAPVTETKSKNAPAQQSCSRPEDNPRATPAQPSDPSKSSQSQPQYQYVSPVEDAAAAQQVLKRSLDSNITLTNRELLAICPDVCKSIKELTTTKRITVGGVNLVGFNESHESHGTLEYESLVFPDVLVALTGQAAGPAAEESLPLRMINAVLDDKVEVDCVLDQGVVVCIIRGDVWERLGIHLRSDQAMSLESADAGQLTTLGLIENLKVSIAGINLVLQVQVVSRAPFEALLGRPFFAITECATKDYVNGDQHLTLTDPNDRSRHCRVATGIWEHIRHSAIAYE